MCLLFAWREKMIVRELGAQHGSSPATNCLASPPSAGTTQIEKFPLPTVKAICLPSGDQSGLVTLPKAPVVCNGTSAPPLALIFRKRARPLRCTKQISVPSGDHVGAESSSREIVSWRASPPLMSLTHKFGLPPRLEIKATCRPSLEMAAL